MSIFLYDFLSIFVSLNQVFNIDHVIKKLICFIFNVYVFDIFHLYV